MKKLLFIFSAVMFLNFIAQSQCIQNCSGYTLSPITFSTFPSNGNNVNNGFSPNSDDGYTSPIALGFNFNFYCTTYSTVLICSNGFIVFGSLPFINGSDPAQALPSTVSPNGIIALNMNDFDVGAGGNITFTTIGTSPNQQFIVTFSNVPIWYDAVTNTPSVPVYNTGQIVLYETSNMIEIHTGSVGLSPYIGTQGIENTSGTSGLAVTGRNAVAWSGSNSAYRWSKTLVGAPPTGLAGNTLVCFGDQGLVYTCNSMPGAVGYNWSLPGGWTGTSTSTNVTAGAGITGNLSVTATYSSCGTSSPAVISVSVNPPPFINVIGVSPPVVCSGNAAVIDLSGASSYTINPGAISGTSPLNVLTQANTVYSVTGTSVNGCVNPTPVPISLVVNQTPTVTVNSGTLCLGQSFTLNPSGAVSYTFSSLFSVVTPNATGNFSYLVIGDGGNGCVNTATSSVVVNPLPPTTAISTRTNVCLGEKAFFNVQGAATYSWVNTGGNATSSSQTVSPTSTTQYSVTGTSSLGCSQTAAITISVSFCTGINEGNAKLAEARVYPNPSAGEFKIDAWVGAIITVYDILGKEILRERLLQENQLINLMDKPAGSYLLKITDEGAEKKILLIKQ